MMEMWGENNSILSIALRDRVACWEPVPLYVDARDLGVELQGHHVYDLGSQMIKQETKQQTDECFDKDRDRPVCASYSAN
jgi:hypothetical protein